MSFYKLKWTRPVVNTFFFFCMQYTHTRAHSVCLCVRAHVVELAMIMDRLYGGVCYAGIDTDPELKYPKGAGRVAFSNQQSYIAAISARFVQLQHNDIDKRVSANKSAVCCFSPVTVQLVVSWD